MRAAIQALLPITEFHDFHPDPNINFQLNRFLVPGLETFKREVANNDVAAPKSPRSGLLLPGVRQYARAVSDREDLLSGSSLRQNCGRSQSCKLSSEETSTDLIDLLARSQR